MQMNGPGVSVRKRRGPGGLAVGALAGLRACGQGQRGQASAVSPHSGRVSQAGFGGKLVQMHRVTRTHRFPVPAVNY